MPAIVVGFALMDSSHDLSVGWKKNLGLILGRIYPKKDTVLGTSKLRKRHGGYSKSMFFFHMDEISSGP